MYPYTLVGNCQSSALVNQEGSVDWLCFPRPDSPPVFGKLLDPNGGHFSIVARDTEKIEQHYIPNTNILVTRVTTKSGDVFDIEDFCPRFFQYGRIFRPAMLIRIVRPVKGSPQIQVDCCPVSGWEKEHVKYQRGNAHLRWEIRNDALRLTTNMSLTELTEGGFTICREPLYFAISWAQAVQDDVGMVCESFFKQTKQYWRRWVQHCRIPTLYQKETIRSALALKLHIFEDTGAILAALTTSLPEELGGNRNWDYRFCWMRDAYFILTAFYQLGQYEEAEDFLKFVLDIALEHEYARDLIYPVYTLDRKQPIPEELHPNWAGYCGSQPVRSNNQAGEHIQNDVYGELILTLTPIYFDERFQHLRTNDHAQLLRYLARLAARKISEKDAGIWELRGGWQEHSFSNLMCWAGLDRICRIQELGFLPAFDWNIAEERRRAEKAVLAAMKEGVVRVGPKNETIDASLLLLPILKFPHEDVNHTTVERISQDLRVGGNNDFAPFLYRYRYHDDFGMPKSSFMICSFWLVQALARVGENARARDLLQQALKAASPQGLFSEHYDPVRHMQLGNFPQAYSHVGLINAAFAVSPPWHEVL